MPADKMQGPPFLVGYGVAHFGKSMLWHSSELLFTFFLTEACGLSPMQAVAILSGSLFLNATADALLGHKLSHKMSTIGTAGHLQLIGALVASVAFVSFGTTGLLPTSLRACFAIVAIMIFRLSYPVIDVSQNAMLALATRSDVGRAKLSSLRYIYGGAADLLVALAFAPLFIGYPAAALAWHFMLLSALIAAFAIFGAIALRRALARDPVPMVGGQACAAASSTADGIATGWRCGIAIFPMIFMLSVASAGFGRLMPYMAAFMLQRPTSAAGLVVGLALANIASQPLWAWLATRMPLVNILSIAAALTSLSGLVLWATGSATLAAHIIFILAYGAGSGGMRMSLWALAAARSAVRANASFSTFGFLTAWSKGGIATGAIVAAWLLSSADYRTTLAWRDTLMSLASLLPLTSGLVMLVFIHLLKTIENKQVRNSILQKTRLPIDVK